MKGERERPKAEDTRNMMIDMFHYYIATKEKVLLVSGILMIPSGIVFLGFVTVDQCVCRFTHEQKNIFSELLIFSSYETVLQIHKFLITGTELLYGRTTFLKLQTFLLTYKSLFTSTKPFYEQTIVLQQI